METVTKKEVADALREIIANSPSTIELYPLLCAIAGVAHKMYPLSLGEDLYEPKKAST